MTNGSLLRPLLVCVPLLLLAGCGGTTPAPAPKQAAAVAKPADESRRFPSANRTRITVVDDHLLGKAFLPGGNLAAYQGKAGTYQQFLAKLATPEQAALVLFDYKSSLKDSKYVPHMGAYYGMDGTQPTYVLSKGPWLAGFVGLPEQQAEPLAREFAARLN